MDHGTVRSSGCARVKDNSRQCVPVFLPDLLMFSVIAAKAGQKPTAGVERLQGGRGLDPGLRRDDEDAPG